MTATCLPPLRNGAALAAEARLIYTLLDALADAGLISEPLLRQRWHSLRQRIAEISYEAEGAALYELLRELAATGRLAHSHWERRWDHIQVKAGGELELARPPRGPRLTESALLQTRGSVVFGPAGEARPSRS